MIACINCSLYNLGPPTRIANIIGTSSTNIISDKLSIYYQNVQGLIPFTELNKSHPNLDSTKLCELHTYIYDKCPDIVVLNETWFKNSMLDGEILLSDRYKIFRKDRTHFSHPPDPDSPLKFKRNGGGVLIAVSFSLQLSSCRINLNCKAEILAVEIVLNDTSKVVITTCYRVGTLGINNCHEICNAITKLIADELKFSLCRKEFKRLIRSKMRDNLYCSNDRNDICKQFWSHLKSKSSTNRIPEVLKHEGSISSNNLTKANLFNVYFQKQFSNSSVYDINVNFSNDELFYIDFSCTRIKQLLDDINTNKAAGPDGIHGCILKYCSISLCRPLSIIPIHKKGDKSIVENYRPISLLCLSAKIMERVLQDELLSKTQEFLNATQHGFILGKSCTTNLITLTGNIANNLAKDI